MIIIMLNAKRFFKNILKTLKSGRRFDVTLRHYQVKKVKVKTRIYKDVKTIKYLCPMGILPNVKQNEPIGKETKVSSEKFGAN